VNESLLQTAVRRYGAERVAAMFTPEQLEDLRWQWRAWARPQQIAPDGDWLVWLVLAGRGFGKTRMGAEWVRERVRDGARRLILAGPTAGDVRDVMVEGESGILAVSPPHERPLYEPSKLRLTWPNGAVATLLSADEPERFRGKQGDTVWCDELAAWRYPEAWEQLQFTMRLGSPRYMVTTTPKPTPIIRELARDPRTVVTRGSTYDNAANLAPEFIERIRAKYEGTRLGRQEVHAEVLDDVPGALWTRAMLESTRVMVAPALGRRVVGVDPSGGGDAVGIVGAGRGVVDGHGYVLADRTVLGATPDGWAREAIKLAIDIGAHAIVAERNFGGDMVKATIERAALDMGVALEVKVVTASRGKTVRAEPISALYEQRRVHHVGVCKCPRGTVETVHIPGCLEPLEDELLRFTSTGVEGASPNRADAKVWALTDLMIPDDETASTVVATPSAPSRRSRDF
jgi:phage terminase large subunit-like protein